MKTGFFLCSFSLQGKICFHYRFFPVKKNYTGKPLFSLQGGFAVWPPLLPDKVMAKDFLIFVHSMPYMLNCIFKIMNHQRISTF
jgi:hypothetical protein